MPGKPSRADLEAAAGKMVPDVIAPGLKVLFCGINPGLYSGYTGHHFARPGNRFWPTLYAAGFTPRLLRPEEERELLPLGYGITNLVERATASAAELNEAELVEGGRRLAAKVEAFRPRVVAVLGVSAYRAAFKESKATLGEQPHGLAGSRLWILPNPSGLNAHYTPAELAAVFRDFCLVVNPQSDAD
ncbi:MAG: G/U mismatch-specific DNA glycosylase [Nitrososphaerales archaeon]